MGMLPPILVELKATSGEFMAKMGEARHEIEHLETKGSANIKKFATVGKAALLGFAGAAVVVGGLAVKAALEGEQAHAALAQAVKNTGSSFEEFEPKVEGVTGKFAKLGISRDQLEQGLTVLTTSLRSPEKAMANIGLAADLAAYKHIGLSDAALIVAKAMEGQLKPMKALGIDLPVAAGGALKLQTASAKLADAQDKLKLAEQKVAETQGGAHTRALAALAKAHENVDRATAKLTTTQGASKQIVDALTHAVGGQATAASETYAGKLKMVQASSENLLENLGNKLLPIIAKIIDKTVQLVTWFEKHRNAAIALAIVVGGPLAAAMLLAAVSFLIANAAIIAIGLAIAGLVVAVVWLTANWRQAWADIKKVLSDAWQWIDGIWQKLGAATIPLKLYVAALRFEFDIAWAAIKLAVRVAYDAIRIIIDLFTGNFHDLGKRVGDVGSAFKSAWGSVESAVSTAWGTVSPIIDAILNALGKVAGAVNDALGALGKVGSGLGKIGGFISHPHIPGLATGGYVTSPTLAMVGEGREHEWVLPDSKLRGALADASRNGGGGGVMQVNVYLDGQQVHSSVQKADRKYRLRNGQSAFA